MKILMTGATARMVNSNKTLIKYTNGSDCLYKILTLLGHTVDWKAIEPGEDISGYDLALVGMAMPLSRGSGRLPSCAWVLNQYPRSILYVDDWAIGNLGQNCAGAADNWPQYLKFRAEWKSLDEKYLNLTRDMLASLKPDATCPWPMLVPMYAGWGNHEKIFEGNIGITGSKLWDYDPSTLVDKIEVKIPEERKQMWTLAFLSNQQPWANKLRCSWPILKIGHRGSHQPQFHEKEYLEVCAENLGFLVSKYPKIIGTAWWRPRFFHAHWVKAVTYCDPGDGQLIGNSYCHPIAELEAMTTENLYGVSCLQEMELTRHFMSKNKVLELMKKRLETIHG